MFKEVCKCFFFIPFEYNIHHQVVVASIVDGSRKAPLRMQGIAGHDRIAEVTTGEQRWDGAQPLEWLVPGA